MIDWREHLVRDPEICRGELCAAGTRVPVTVILDSLAEGAGRDEILLGYPTLRSVHVDAALVYFAFKRGIDTDRLNQLVNEPDADECAQVSPEA